MEGPWSLSFGGGHEPLRLVDHPAIGVPLAAGISLSRPLLGES
jgi:hypothetical protein